MRATMVLVLACVAVGCGGTAAPRATPPVDAGVDKPKAKPPGSDAAAGSGVVDAAPKPETPTPQLYACFARPGFHSCAPVPPELCRASSGCKLSGGCSARGAAGGNNNYACPDVTSAASCPAACRWDALATDKRCSGGGACTENVDQATCAQLPECVWSPAVCALDNAAIFDCTKRDDRDTCILNPVCEYLPVGADGGVVSIAPPTGDPVKTSTVCGDVPDAGTDAGAGVTSSGLGCNTVSPTGPCVDQTASTGTPPTPQGGTIVPGTYDLVALTTYSYDAGANAQRETLVIAQWGTGVVAQGAALTGALFARTTFAFMPAADTVTIEQHCPTFGPASSDYTATPTTLTLFDFVNVSNNQSGWGVKVGVFKLR